jgi:hypothetical protein
MQLQARNALPAGPWRPRPCPRTELKKELHKALLVLALGISVSLLALVAVIYGLMGAWLSLKGVLGAVTASFVLAAGFVLFSLVALGLLSSVLNRARRTSVSS